MVRRRTLWWRLIVMLLVMVPPTGVRHAVDSRLPPRRDGGIAARTPADYVNPFVGTDAGQPNYGLGGASGNTFPGATWPFGMVQWSPDTTSSLSDHAAGYAYPDRTIRGFSLTHLSGTGCPIYQDVPIMPILGAPSVSPAAAGGRMSTVGRTQYTATFRHADEWATPGDYGVRLGSGVTVELSVTRRTGFGVFTFPATSTATLLVNNGGSANAASGARVSIDGAADIAGSVTSGGFCGTASPYTLYYVARFNRPFGAFGTWTGKILAPGTAVNQGTNCGAYVSFDTRRNHVIQVKVGISFVSIANARANLEREGAGWDFQRVRAAAYTAWNGMLSRITVEGGTAGERRTFYTAIYHTLLFPSTFSDEDGQYLGFDQRIHTAMYRDARGRRVSYVQYANYSGWDIYRSEVPLLALLAPHETGDMVQSLVADAQQSGWLPKWSIANSQTSVMVGDPSDPIIASAYALGAGHFDTRAALHAMLKGATRPQPRTYRGYVERPGLEEYLARGYVTEERDGLRGTPAYVWGPAATTLEYALDDFAIAQLAGALGETSTRRTFLRRAQNWQTLYNPATRYIAPRWANGRFSGAYDPASRAGYVEGNGAQYTWMVPHNLRALFARMGGPSAAAARLDRFFTRINGGPDRPYGFLGNEPSAGTPWEYDFLGEPWRTQEVVRRAVLHLYDAAPGGLPGNDDLGQMSAWYVFAAIGLYPEIPGVGELVIGSPLFRQVTLHLAGGDVTISAPNASDTTPYVQGLRLDGRPYRKPWLPISRLAHGAKLQFDLGATPNLRWGANPADAPPSFDASPLHALPPTPHPAG